MKWFRRQKPAESPGAAISLGSARRDALERGEPDVLGEAMRTKLQEIYDQLIADNPGQDAEVRDYMMKQLGLPDLVIRNGRVLK